MSTPTRLQQLIEPIVTGLGLELYDLHHSGSVLSVLVDRPAPATDPEGDPQGGGRRSGVDLDALTRATRAVSRALDDADPIAGHYSLEVSSPGLERPLRAPEHFARALGETVSVKAAAHHDGPRRLRGELVRATGPDDPEPSIDVRLAGTGELHRIALADIDKARTVFEWGPPPKPGKGRSGKATRQGSAGSGATTGVTINADDKKVSAT